MSTDEESFPRGDIDRPPDTHRAVTATGPDGFPDSLSFSDCLSIDESLRMYRVRPLERRPSFRIYIRQHAKHGLAVGDGTPHARGARPLPLDPPIVCEVVTENDEYNSLLNVLELSVRARLVHLDGPANVVAATNAGLPLLGDVDQSAFVAQVYPPRDQSFFIFSELSVRPTGTFRLRFDIIDHSLSSFRIVGSIFSRPFVVHDKKTYPGLSPSTDLILAIIERGLKLRLVKDNDPKKSAAKKKQRSSESDHVSTTRAGSDGTAAEESGPSRAQKRASPSSPPSIAWFPSPVSTQRILTSPRQEEKNLDGSWRTPPRRRAYTHAVGVATKTDRHLHASQDSGGGGAGGGSRSTLASPRLHPPDTSNEGHRGHGESIVSPVRMPGPPVSDERSGLAMRPSLPSIRFILEAAHATHSSASSRQPWQTTDPQPYDGGQQESQRYINTRSSPEPGHYKAQPPHSQTPHYHHHGIPHPQDPQRYNNGMPHRPPDDSRQ